MPEPGRTIRARDALLASAVTALQVVGVLLRGPDAHELPITDLSGLGIVLLVVSGLSLVLRRRWPTAVVLVAAVTSACYYLLDFSDGPAHVALFIALWTLTANGDGRRSVRLAAGVIGALAVVWMVAALDITPPQAIGWVFFRIVAAVGSAALGESTRARRVILADALARAELAELTREEEARARVADERVRIAREVHDSVAHAIAVINVQAGVTAHVLDKRPDLTRDTLRAIEQTSSRALEEMRSILGMLRSPDGSRAPVPGLADVHELVDQARRAGIEVEYDALPADISLPGAVGTAAYRIIQESLTNIIRHVGSTRARVHLEYSPDVLSVSVTDHGPRVGARETTQHAGAMAGAGTGHGIRGMRERCELLGGTLEAAPGPDQGFVVRARLPLGAHVEVDG